MLNIELLQVFNSQEDFIKMLPGMERKLTEHMMVHHYTATASEASARSLQEVPLLKGSFGHHSSSLGHGVAASSSQESLYGSQHHHQPGASGGGPPILASDSLYSLRGQHHSSQRSSALGMWNSSHGFCIPLTWTGSFYNCSHGGNRSRCTRTSKAAHWTRVLGWGSCGCHGHHEFLSLLGSHHFFIFHANDLNGSLGNAAKEPWERFRRFEEL